MPFQTSSRDKARLFLIALSSMSFTTCLTSQLLKPTGMKNGLILRDSRFAHEPGLELLLDTSVDSKKSLEVTFDVLVVDHKNADLLIGFDCWKNLYDKKLVLWNVQKNDPEYLWAKDLKSHTRYYGRGILLPDGSIAPCPRVGPWKFGGVIPDPISKPLNTAMLNLHDKK